MSSFFAEGKKIFGRNFFFKGKIAISSLIFFNPTLESARRIFFYSDTFKCLDTIQDFLCKLGMKPHMHVVEKSIFSLNHVITIPIKIIKDQ